MWKLIDASDDFWKDIGNVSSQNRRLPTLAPLLRSSEVTKSIERYSMTTLMVRPKICTLIVLGTVEPNRTIRIFTACMIWTDPNLSDAKCGFVENVRISGQMDKVRGKCRPLAGRQLNFIKYVWNFCLNQQFKVLLRCRLMICAVNVPCDRRKFIWR